MVLRKISSHLVSGSRKDMQCSLSFERDWNHSKVLRKSSDDTRHCSTNERGTVDTIQSR